MSTKSKRSTILTINEAVGKYEPKDIEQILSSSPEVVLGIGSTLYGRGPEQGTWYGASGVSVALEDDKGTISISIEYDDERLFTDDEIGKLCNQPQEYSIADNLLKQLTDTIVEINSKEA